MLFLPRHTHILLVRIKNIVICVQNKHYRTHVWLCLVVEHSAISAFTTHTHTHTFLRWCDILHCVHLKAQTDVCDSAASTARILYAAISIHYCLHSQVCGSFWRKSWIQRKYRKKTPSLSSSKKSFVLPMAEIIRTPFFHHKYFPAKYSHAFVLFFLLLFSYIYIYN